jgi:hypothetical protein
MAIYIDYEGSRYQLSASIQSHEAFSQIVDRLNHSWRRQQDRQARPDDSGKAYIAEDYDPWVHFPLESGGMMSIHVHDAMHLVFVDTERTP